MATSEQLFNAIDHYLQGTATEQEKLLVNTWYYSFDDELVEVNSADRELLSKIETHLRSRLTQSTGIAMPLISTPSKLRIFTLTRIAAAAAILIFISISVYFIAIHKSPPPLSAKRYDIVPGGNKAILTLASGQQIILNSTKNGTIATQNGANINKKVNGQIAYVSSGNSSTAVINYNTLTTQRGGQYQVILPDGSKVWLNAASSLKYPVRFANNERKVELAGEAYFEVAKDPLHPFVVEGRNQEVQVLGTHFNINAYDDEPAVTTSLLEGSVKITSGGTSRFLVPGQQGKCTADGIKVSTADVDAAIDWKRGDFDLNHLNFKAAMRKIARWYDVNVVYESAVPDDMESGGWISRDRPLTDVLSSMEASGLAKFKIEGTTVHVYLPTAKTNN